MPNRYLISGGMALFGILASLEGLARILSGTHELYNGAKHPWLAGFFMIFGPFAPYASAALSFAIGALFFYMAYRVFRTSTVSNAQDSRDHNHHSENDK